MIAHKEILVDQCPGNVSRSVVLDLGEYVDPIQ